jgi:hypothetical protein
MSSNRRRRRSGAQTSGNPQRRAQQERPRTSGPDYDRIAELQEELRIARQAEEIEFDERLEDELDDGYEDDVEEEPRQRVRGDRDKPKFVHHQGERYRLPASPDDWDVDALEAFEAGKVVTAIKGILGPKAWGQLRANHEGTLRVRDLEPLMDQIAKAYGFDSVGE